MRQAVPGDAGAIRALTRAAYAKWVPVIGREPLPMVADYEAAVGKHRFDLLYVDGVLAALIETVPKDDHLLIENVAVGVFGAFIGGDFVAAMISGAKVVNDKDFRISSLAMAVAGAVVMLVVLRLMRGAVGPMRAGKSKAGRRN